MTAANRTVALRPRAVLVSCVFFYICAYIVAYAFLLAPLFAYFGLGLTQPVDPLRIAAPAILALAPAFWLPLRMEKPSTFLFSVQYYIVYVPGCFVAFLSTRPALPFGQSLLLALTLLLGLAILLVGQRALPLLRLPRFAAPGAIYWIAFCAVALTLMVTIAAKLGGNFQLAGIDEIYDVRAAGSERLGGNVLLVYALNWLNALVLPFVMAYALFARRKFLLLVVAACYVFLFGVWGSKASLLAPIFISLIYLLVRQRADRVSWLLPLGLAAIILSPALIPTPNDLMQLARDWAVQIVPQRTFSSSALLIVQYLEFFTVNPNTFGSHVSVVREFLPDVYPAAIAPTIGWYTYGGPMTANANFWATDGIAGFGLPGIPMLSVICALVFWLLDSATRHVAPSFSIVAMAYIGTNFADTGLFTTLLTGGLLFLVLLLHLVPIDFRFLRTAQS
ncbi:MAG: hypothetical protein QY320_01520 [Gammaproteobacteria bacterium]|nr:MAG: hypothetical protein QY320_01520 [Gammaproteobacteria bacterium]